MSRFLPWRSGFTRVCLILALTALPLMAMAEETGLLDKAEEEAVTYDPQRVDEDDFDTNVDPLHESSLQGFDCMDSDGNGYLSMGELEKRHECVKRAGERGMPDDTRTALILTRMDADRDRQVSRREFNIWNEMQSQNSGDL